MEINSSAFVATPEHIAELDRLGDEIADLSAHLEAATARLLDLIREFDAREGWANGFCSCAAWLSWRVGLDRGAAREKVRVARALGTLPRLAGALACGELSYSKVRALTRVPRRRLKSGCWQWSGPARPSTSSASFAAGGAWIGTRRTKRPPGFTRAARFTCIRTRTAWLWSAGGEEGVGISRSAAALPRCCRARGAWGPVEAPHPNNPGAGGRAGAAGGNGAAPTRSRRAGRALSGGGPRRRRGAGGSGSAGPVRPRGRRARSS